MTAQAGNSGNDGHFAATVSGGCVEGHHDGAGADPGGAASRPQFGRAAARGDEAIGQAIEGG